MVLHVVVAHAQLERVPVEIAGHPAVRKQAQVYGKKPSDLILDQNYHRQAMKQIEEPEARGRPDIVHYCLLNLLETPLARKGQLRAWVHTRNGELIGFKPDTRLPRGESRFNGVMSRVLKDGRSHDENPLVWVEGRMTPQDVLSKFARMPVVRLCETGTIKTPLQVAEKAKEGDLVLLIGGFAHGDWPKEWSKVTPEAASLWNEPLNAWTVCAEVVAGYRARHGPFEA